MRGDYFQPNYLSPANYFAMLLGCVFRIKNVLLLFKFSELIEQLILLAGTYLLSRSLFKERATAFFVSLGVIGSTVWFIQIFWNLRIYYMIPLVLYFFLRFVKEINFRYMIIAGIVWIGGLFGVPGYHAALHLLIYGIFLMLAFAYCPWKEVVLSFRNFFKDRINLLLLTVFLLTLGLFLYVQLNLYESIQAQVYARDPITHKTPVDVFVTYAENTDVSKLLGFFFAGMSENMYYTIYLGLIPLLFWVYGMIRVRSVEFAVLSSISGFLVLFSLGDSTFVARTVYHLFPPMQYFRYIGGIRGILRIFVMISSGFGLDAFLQDYGADRDGGEAKKVLWWSGVGFLLFIFFLNWIDHDGKLYRKDWPDFFYFSVLMLFVLLVIFTSRSSVSLKTLKIILVGFFLTELLSYQNLVYASWPTKWAWAKPEVSQVSPYGFQPQRYFKQDINSRVREATKVAESINDQLAVETYSFIQFDPCVPVYLKIYEPVGLSRLIDLRAHVLRKNFTSQEFFAAPEVPEFLRVIGCQSPKLKLVSNVLFANNLDEAGLLVRDTSNIGEQIVLENAPKSLQSSYVSQNEDPDSIGKVGVTHFEFNRLDADLEVSRKEGAFLYYADSFHSGWHAYLDHKETPVLEANLAFKAVFIPEGKHAIQFVYFDGLRSIASLGMVMFGVLFCLVLLFLLFRILPTL